SERGFAGSLGRRGPDGLCGGFHGHVPAARPSEVLIVWTGAAFRRGPVDDLVRILDVAGLAVNAIGRVDLQAPATLAVIHHLVHTGGTEVLTGVAIFLGATIHADRRVQHLQVH